MSTIKRFISLMFCAFIALQLFFAVRIALGNIIPIRSTAFERTAAIALLQTGELNLWQHTWRSYSAISDNLKRAVIASEDSRFEQHRGVEWEAIWKAWQHNQKIQTTHQTRRKPAAGTPPIRGGSTITQQLAKNLFLSSEQNYLRKAQELFITLALETLLTKENLLELYLNHAEWGHGIYGAQGAATFYFKSNASSLSPQQAATLAAMLPRPRYHQKTPNSPYLQQRAQQIMRGIPLVSVP